jgi:hypothetical protein
MEAIINQFIPIIIIFIVISHPETVARFSHSILGKCIAVSLIIYYSSLNKYLGMLVCGFVIFYYQTDYVEGFDLLYKSEGMENLYQNPLIDNTSIHNVMETTGNNITTLLNNSYKQFTYYTDLYNDVPKAKLTSPMETDFRKEYCDAKGNLTYKNSIINLEMISFLFPEIKFDKDKCNPCSPTCKFSIIESKLATQEKMKPISTIS